MKVRYIPEITAIIFELLAVDNNKLTQRKESHYCKSLNLIQERKLKEFNIQWFLSLNIISRKTNAWTWESLPD